MFLRFVIESLRRAPKRKAMTVAAVAMGSAVATAMLGVMLDIGDKVNRELRSVGANLIVTPRALGAPVEIAGVRAVPVGQAAYIPEDQIPKIKSIFWQLNITGFAPSLTAAASVPVEGVWFHRRYRTPDGREQQTGIRDLNPAWQMDGRWIDDGDSAAVYDCMPGAAAARKLGLAVGSTAHLLGHDFMVAGILRTGSDEDDRVLVRLNVLQEILHRKGQVDSLQVGAITKPEDAFARKDPRRMSSAELERWNCTNYVSSIAHQINEVLPMAIARPVWRVADNEGRVLSRIGGLMLLIALAALASAGITVWSVMATTVLERRGEIAIMQATGAGDWLIACLFGAEVAMEGLAGGVVGALAGVELASWVGRSVFRAGIEAPPVLIPLVIVVAVLVALLGAAQPLRRSLVTPPALVLREGV